MDYTLTPEAIELGLSGALPAILEIDCQIGEFGRGERDSPFLTHVNGRPPFTLVNRTRTALGAAPGHGQERLMAVAVRQLPTRRQLEVIRAYITAGSIAAAAYQLGISDTTARQHLSGLYRRTGCLNAAQAAYWLGTSERNIA